MLSSETKVVTYVNKKGERSTYPLSSAMESANLEMVKRLKYTKDILTHMLNSNTAKPGEVAAQATSQSSRPKTNTNTLGGTQDSKGLGGTQKFSATDRMNMKGFQTSSGFNPDEGF